jgi:2-methylisocitrate lyase-like PEP mutase family enzyme
MPVTTTRRPIGIARGISLIQVDRLLETGAVGCNLEDTDHRTGGLIDAGAHAERLAAIRAAAGDAGVPIVISGSVVTSGKKMRYCHKGN